MEELLKSAKDGNIDAYTELFFLLKKDLEKVASIILKDKDYIDDIIQNVYYKAYENLGKLYNDNKFKSWIFTILRNECINANRRISRYQSEADFSEIEEYVSDSSAYNLSSKISFEDMIKKLTKEEQKLLRMKYEEALSNIEIAEELGMPYNTVKSKILRAIKKITLILLILIMISGFTVLATFIIKQIKAHFTTSLKAIDTAVENGYVQEIDSDFVYDNGIGIKVDAIVLDDKNLDISFVYDIQDKEKYGEISGIGIEDYQILSKDKVLFDSMIIEDDLTQYTIQNLELYKKSENEYTNSILFSSKNNFPKLESILIKIKSIYIKSNETIIYINGKWDLQFNIIEKLNERKTEKYIMEENAYVKNYKIILMETSFNLDINFNIDIDIKNIEKIVLFNENNIKIYYDNCNYNKNNKHLNITFDLGKYNENINELILEIPRENNENIILKFRGDG